MRTRPSVKYLHSISIHTLRHVSPFTENSSGRVYGRRWYANPPEKKNMPNRKSLLHLGTCVQPSNKQANQPTSPFHLTRAAVLRAFCFAAIAISRCMCVAESRAVALLSVGYRGESAPHFEFQQQLFVVSPSSSSSSSASSGGCFALLGNGGSVQIVRIA